MYRTLKRIALLAMLAAGSVTIAGCDQERARHSPDRWGPGHMGSGPMGHHGWQWQEMHVGQRQRAIRHWTYMNEGVPSAYQGARNPLRPKAGTLRSGSTLYRQNCSSCHGRSGLGDGEVARSLAPPPAILNSLVQSPMAADEYLLWAISEGGADFGTDMPAFRHTLSRSQIWEIITYMRAGFPDGR